MNTCSLYGASDAASDVPRSKTRVADIQKKVDTTKFLKNNGIL